MGLFILLLPPMEFLVMRAVAQQTGWAFVLLCLFIGVVLGRALMRHGRESLQNAMQSVQPGVSGKPMADGVAWFVIGLLLVIPGFITDLLAALLLVPAVRRRILGGMARQMQSSPFGGGVFMGGAGMQWPPQSSHAGQGEIIDVESTVRDIEEPPLRLPAPSPGEPGGHP